MRAKEFIVEYKKYPTQEYEGVTFTMVEKDGQLIVKPLNDYGISMGHVVFNMDGKILDPQDLVIADKYQGQGIARVMYDYIKSLGFTIERSWDQTPAGKGFWDKHRGEDVRVWEEAQPKSRKIGKRIGGDLYVHKNYAVQAGVPEDVLKNAMSRLPQDYDFVAVKYNQKDGSISFIESPDFDTANEPTVGNAIKVYSDGTVKTTKGLADPMIWHHKWQWVPDDYPGFDVSKSKERSDLWKNKLGTNREVSSRIGRQSYWQNWLKQSNLPT